MIDSQTTGIGLGLLVQAVAAAAAGGVPPNKIEGIIRATIPHIYMLICIPELTHLADAGYMGRSQALVAEMMGMLPIFTLEEGRLSPIEKVRTQRHMFEAFHVFMNEFEAPAQVALVQGEGNSSIRSRSVRQFVEETFPETPFHECVTSDHQAALFGPHSTALVVMDKLDLRLS